MRSLDAGTKPSVRQMLTSTNQCRCSIRGHCLVSIDPVAKSTAQVKRRCASLWGSTPRTRCSPQYSRGLMSPRRYQFEPGLTSSSHSRTSGAGAVHGPVASQIQWARVPMRLALGVGFGSRGAVAPSHWLDDQMALLSRRRVGRDKHPSEVEQIILTER